MPSSVVFFFFQAEDGIRDRTVTGVQTCALPILGGGSRCRAPPPTRGLPARGPAPRGTSGTSSRCCSRRRSEERRVGKECRARRLTRYRKKKSWGVLEGEWVVTSAGRRRGGGLSQ